MAAIQRNGVGIPEDVSTVLADVSCAFSPALFSVFLTEGSSFSLLFSVFLLSAPVTSADSGFSETAGVPSASFFPEDEEEPEEPSRFELWLDRHLGSEKAASFFITVAVVLGNVFSVGLFILLPTALTGLVGLAVPLPMWLRNLLEGVVRIVIFMGYLMLCSHMKDIRRVFQYHGAEHKTIFCYEHGLPLTVENVRIQPRHHPRCGTSFLFVVIVVSILLSSVLFSFVEVTNTFARLGLLLLLLPVIVSLSFELKRVVGRYDNRLTRLVSAPGMWLQNWTTFEPDDSMIEVGIRAFTLVLPEEKGKDQW